MALANIKQEVWNALDTTALPDGAQFYFFQPDTDRLMALYQDRHMTTTRANPVVFKQSKGYQSVYMLEPVYDMEIRDPRGTLLAKATSLLGLEPDQHATTFTTVQELLRDKVLTLATGADIITLTQSSQASDGYLLPGDLLWVALGNFTYRVAAEDATDFHLQTQGGVKLYVQIGERGYNARAFGAYGNGINDDTEALRLAQKAGVDFADDQRTGGLAYLPEGRYLVDNLQIFDRGGLSGDGYEISRLVQKTDTSSALNMTSEYAMGQILSARVERIGIEGRATSTAPAFLISARSPFAIHRSHIDVMVTNCSRAIHIEASDDNNFYGNTLRLFSAKSSDTAFTTTGGVYNRYDLFLTGCASGKACQLAGFHNQYERLVADGQIASTEQSSIYYDPTIEGWAGAALPAGEPLQKYTGFNQMLLQPTVNLSAEAVTNSGAEFAFQPGQQSVMINPRVLGVGPAHPIKIVSDAPVTLIGPGQNNCQNKIEAYFDGSSPSKNPRIISFVGSNEAWSDNPAGNGSATIQVEQPTGGTTLNINPSSDVLLIDSSVDIAGVNLRMDFNFSRATLIPNRVIRVRTKRKISTLNLASQAGADVSELPTSLAAGSWFSCVYRAATHKYHLISQSGVLSTGTAGGMGSAGAGKQYVAMTIGGTTYKVLHDGTI